jgi:DNA (cytosine-5)-methyltransferase 1
MKPRLLDLFCGAGGASAGYAWSGFEVVGVDHVPQPDYPYEFHLADALEFPVDGFDAIHASPPCQAYSQLRHMRDIEYPELVEPTRDRLVAAGVPYVIENVPGAPLINPRVLCGTNFMLNYEGRYLRRHRLFETNWPLAEPGNCFCRDVKTGGVYGHGGGQNKHNGGFKFPVGQARLVMGIDWMDRYTLSQAIPPAYTRWIGEQLGKHLVIGSTMKV